MEDSNSLEAVFRVLSESLDTPIRRFIKRTLGVNADDYTVDDVMQETLIALYDKLKNEDQRITLANARPYAFGIARNLCYEVIRRSKRRVVSLEDDHDQVDDLGGEFSGSYAVIADGAPMPEDAAYWLMLNLEVQAAIDRLPAVHRQVLTLYTEEEMTYDEIAQVMGTNIGTVKSRLHYAKKTLRGMLSPATVEAIEG